MKWEQVADLPCPVARTLSVVGDRWTLLIIRDAFLGMRRFEDFQSDLGLTRHLLADRLKRLTEAGVFSRQAYQQSPLRHEYRLTAMGKALYPVILALTQWGNTWMDRGEGPIIEYRHRTCGQKMTPQMACSECGELLDPREITPMPGPGARFNAAGRVAKA